jgi:hypothetical protein
MALAEEIVIIHQDISLATLMIGWFQATSFASKASSSSIFQIMIFTCST